MYKIIIHVTKLGHHDYMKAFKPRKDYVQHDPFEDFNDKGNEQ
jgi:hypothetical protein